MPLAEFVEKRSFQRMEVECRVEFREPSGSLSGSGVLENVSARGIRFISDQALDREANLKITMRGSEDDQPLHGDAVVLRCERADRGYRVACILNAIE